MPVWLKIAAGAVLAVSLIGLAGFHGFSRSSARSFRSTAPPITTARGRHRAPVICKPESAILAAIDQVHAKFDHLAGADLKAFQERARDFKGLPPLNADELYVVTEDDKLRDGEMVLFIGLKAKCVTTVFGFSGEALPRDPGQGET